MKIVAKTVCKAAKAIPVFGKLIDLIEVLAD